MSELVIAVKTSTDQAQKGFKDLGNKISDLSSKAEKFSSMGKIAVGAFIGSLASQATVGAFNLFRSGITSIISTFQDSIELAGVQEEAVNDLNTSLALAGNYSEETSKKFQDFASSLQEVTTFGDEVILKNAALLQSFAKLDEEGLERATTAAVNFSAVTGKDLSTSMDLLAKAATGNVSMLSRYGIVIKSTGDSAKDFQEVLSTIEKQFGGAASAKINTYAGATSQLSNTFGDLKEAVGDLITSNPLVIEGIKTLQEIFASLIKIITENKTAIKDLTGEGFIYLISTIPNLASGISSIIELFGYARSLSNVFADAILALIETFYEYQKAVLSVQSSIQKFFGGQAELTTKLISDTEKSINIIKKSREANDEEATAKIGNAQNIAEKLQSFADNTTKMLAKNAERAKTISNDETKNYLTNLSKKNEGAKAADKNAEELAKKEEDRLLKASQLRDKELADAAAADLKYYEETLKIKEQQQKEIQNVMGGGLSAAINPEVSRERLLSGDEQSTLTRNRAIAATTGTLSSILGGSEGAKELLVGGGQAVANAILPGLGEAVGPILEKLAEGPEAVKQFIKDFVASVPTLITNIVEAIPAVFEALTEQMPLLLDSLIDSLPRLINALVEKMPIAVNAFAVQMPFVATQFAINIVKNIPAIVSGIASGAYNAIVEMFNNLNPFSSDSAVGGFFSDVGDFLGFAEGGYIKKVPNGYPNDSFPARLTEGELVVDKSNAQKLEQFLNSQNDNSNILNNILNAVSTPMTVESKVQVNQQTFANIILELSRQNRRLA